MMKTNEGYVSIWCTADIYPAVGYKVTIYNSYGDAVCMSKTDKHGRVVCTVPVCDKYRIVVESIEGFAPSKAFRWAALSPFKKYGLYFIFHKETCSPRKGRFTLTLTDANYPNLKLRNGPNFINLFC